MKSSQRKNENSSPLSGKDALAALRRAAIHAQEKAEKHGLKAVVSNESSHEKNRSA